MSLDVTTTDAEPDAGELRRHLVNEVIDRWAPLDISISAPVLAAMRRVPRHLFTPGVGLVEAYADDVVRYQRDEDGIVMSSVSAPNMIALMLDQLDVQTGHRVLEIGSGGYNAALLAGLVGPEGAVTTVDIDADVTARARASLDEAGYPGVHVITGDGEHGAPELAPFDRVIMTVEAWDLPPAWIEQLAPGGRLVVPLLLRGQTRSVAFDRDGDHLVSANHHLCGFVPMRGVGQHRRPRLLLHDGQVTLRVDYGPVPDAATLDTALAGPAHTMWSGVTIGRGESFELLNLWLDLTEPRLGVLTAEPEPIAVGLVDRLAKYGVTVVHSDTSMAHRAMRPVDGELGLHEFGATGHGPDAAELAALLVDGIRQWDATIRHVSPPKLYVFPAGTADAVLPKGSVVDKTHTRCVVSWSPA